MSNFKIGDVVERLDANFLRLVGPGPHVVTGVGTYGRLQINHWRNGGSYPWSPQYFTLVEGVDDELPPAPKSVRYYTVPSKTQYLDILHNEFGEVEIRSILPDFASYNYLTPDAALQLAHDLNRMANEIKRRERNQT